MRMPEIKLDISDIDKRFWSTIEQERATFIATLNRHNLGRVDLGVGYITQNTTLADVTVDADDEGAAQILASAHIGIS